MSGIPNSFWPARSPSPTNITSSADLYEFELYAENKKIYTPQADLLPLDFTGAELNTQKSINIDIPDSLVNVELTALQISAYDIDDTSEVEIYLNNNGPMRPTAAGICHDSAATFVLSLDTQTLQMGENELRFAYANDFDQGTGGFRIEGAAITITFEILTSVQLGDLANITSQKFKLSQNYPNPFNAQTAIRYALPVSGKVSLKIFNNVGQLVRTLMDQEKSAGEHRAFWDGRTDTKQLVAAGLYFYQLNVENFVKTQKLIYLK